MNGLIPAFHWQRVVIDPWVKYPDISVWILVMGTLIAVTCGLVGTFLLLKKMSLVGDAISHAVLPGIVVAFLVSNSRASFPVFLGAAVFGVLTTMLIDAVSRWTRIKEDAATGVVFPALFALGVVIISVFADKVDLDQQCVLYGEIAFIPLEPMVRFAGIPLGPESVFAMALTTILIIGLIVVFYKPLVLTIFDSALADSLGFRSSFIHFGLMVAVALTVVSAFESVGAILVVAMLIMPGATGYLLSDRLPIILVLSAVHGFLSALLGWHISVWWECSTAGAMVTAGLGMFLLALLFSPSHGILGRLLRLTRLKYQIVEDNLVGFIVRKHEQRVPVTYSVLMKELGWGGLISRLLVSFLSIKGEIRSNRGGVICLTQKGFSRGKRLLENHRLWETFMYRELDLPEDHVDEPAHFLEHFTEEPVRKKLKEGLGDLVLDPQGKPLTINGDQDPSRDEDTES